MKEDILEIIQWWERKRLIYNIVLITISIAGLFLKSEVPNSVLTINSFIVLLIWVIGANAFYCAGWGIEIFIFYYFKIIPLKRYRIILFAMGILISIIWTWINLIQFI